MPERALREAETSTAWQRLRRDFFRPGVGQLAMALVLLIISLVALVIQLEAPAPLAVAAYVFAGAGMGFGFPRDEREALVASEPDKFLMPGPSDMRYQWVCVRLDAIGVLVGLDGAASVTHVRGIDA